MCLYFLNPTPTQTNLSYSEKELLHNNIGYQKLQTKQQQLTPLKPNKGLSPPYSRFRTSFTRSSNNLLDFISHLNFFSGGKKKKKKKREVREQEKLLTSFKKTNFRTSSSAFFVKFSNLSGLCFFVVFFFKSVCVCVCVCVSVCECVSVREREIARENVCMYMREREILNLCTCVCVSFPFYSLEKCPFSLSSRLHFYCINSRYSSFFSCTDQQFGQSPWVDRCECEDKEVAAAADGISIPRDWLLVSVTVFATVGTLVRSGWK